MQDPSDNVTALARAILRHDAASAYEKLVIRQSDFRVSAMQELSQATGARLCAKAVKDATEADCLVGALWLWHDDLETSHGIFQDADTPTGSLWHAILHRREGDFGNAKYWYARAGRHPALPVMAAQASPMLAELPADKLLLRLLPMDGGFDGAALVDLVSRVHQTPEHPLHRTAVALQQLEWRVLFEMGVRTAQG
jgi:hypothetical protein